MKMFDLETVSDWLEHLLLNLEAKETTAELFRKTYLGSKGPVSIYRALVLLDDTIGKELDGIISTCTMDTAHPEDSLDRNLSEHGRLLLRFRIENTHVNIPILLGGQEQNGVRATHALYHRSASIWETANWCLTAFWRVSRTEYFGTRARMLSDELRRRH